MSARILKVNSEIGKQLDSLSDLITFGLAPGFLMFQLFFLIEDQNFFNPLENFPDLMIYKSHYWAYTAFLIPIFSALRLAKFNTDTNQTSNFIGLPTPANALFIVSIILIFYFQLNTLLVNYLFTKYTLAGISIIISLLLISKIPFLGLKFQTIDFQKNKYRYLFLLISLILFSVLNFVASPIILILYCIFSILNHKHEVYSKH